MLTLLFVQTMWIMPASGITWGYVDNPETPEYPYAGAMIGTDGEGNFAGMICSGSLVSENVFLTAGHCAYFFDLFGFTPETIRISFDPKNCFDPDNWLEVGAIFWHPDFNPRSPMANGNHDVGVAILKPDQESVTGIEPAKLPTEGYLDTLLAEDKLRKANLIRVGYGVSLEWPPPEIVPPDGQRWIAEKNKFKALLKRNIKTFQNHAAGGNGVCFGDSGGPVIWIDDEENKIIVGVTSWGDPNCVALSVAYRIDIPEALGFIMDFINGNPAPPAITETKLTTTWGRVKSGF